MDFLVIRWDIYHLVEDRQTYNYPVHCAMPGLLKSPVESAKRKRIGQEEDVRGQRKEKIRRTSDSGDGAYTVANLEEEIQLSQRNYNNIAKLFEIALSKNKTSTNALVSLCRVFCRLLADRKLSTSQTTSRDEATVVTWLKARFDEYNALLRSYMQHERPQQCKLGLTLSMQIVKAELGNAKSAADAVWRNGMFATIINALISAGRANEAIEEFVGEYMQVYDDVRYYTLCIIQ